VSGPPLPGRRSRLVVDRVVDGKMSRAAFPSVSEEIHAVFGSVGQNSTLGESQMWSVAPPGEPGRRVQIEIKPQAGHTLIRIEEVLTLIGGTALVPFFGSAAGAVSAALLAVGIGIPSAPVLLLPAAVGALAGFHLTALTVRAAVKRRRIPQMEALASRLGALVGKP
jgi:hypothetical protein